MSRRIWFAFLAALLYLGFYPVTMIHAARTNPCSEDIAKFCKDVKPGGGAIFNCLETHQNELSQECRAYKARIAGTRAERQERMRQFAALRQACRDDTAKFCKDVKPGSGAIARCLDEHQNELSAPCKEGINSLRQVQQQKKPQ